MKKILTLALFFTFAFEAVPCAAQQSAKEVMELAESIDFNKISEPSIDIERYCYVTGNGFIKPIIDGKNVVGTLAIDDDTIDWVEGSNAQGGLIPAGRINLFLQYAVADSVYGVYQRFDFEAGKSYQVRFLKKEREFYVEEDDGKELESSKNRIKYIESFGTYPAANPGLLDGTWSGETKRAMTSYDMQCRVADNRMVFESRSGRREFVVEGDVQYNENTIILIPDKATANGKDVEDFGLKAKIGDLTRLPGIALKYVWYYTLADGVLTLESNRKPTAGGLMWENDGELRRTAQ